MNNIDTILKPTNHSRWYVKLSGYKDPIKIYRVEEKGIYDLFLNENIESVTPCCDVSYISYIQKLISMSSVIKVENTKSGGIREIYRLHIDSGYIILRFYLDENRGYYDYMEFQERFHGEILKPVSYTCADPTNFYNDYVLDVIKLPDEFISVKQLKKCGAKLFSRKNGEKYWIDKNGYFYFCVTWCYPNKQIKEEYEHFKNNSNAVQVRCWWGIYNNQETKWWDSLEDFLIYFKECKDKTPSWAATPRYEILHKGYKKLPPDERKIIYRYPFLNIDREFRHGKKPFQIARMWRDKCNPKYVSYDYDTEIEKMLIEYIKWKEKENVRKSKSSAS